MNSRRSVARTHSPAGRRRWRVVALAAVLLALVAMLAPAARPASPALAHAYLERSEPAEDAVLDASPAEVSLWFSEPMAPAFSTIEVLDTDGARVNLEDAVVDPDEPTRMSVALPALEDGVYTVSWRNLSTVDGHSLRGWYVFTVGEPVGGPGGPAPEEPPLLGSPLDPVVRWLTLLGATGAVGGLIFRQTVLRGRPGGRGDAGDDGLEARSALITHWSLGVFFAGAVLQLPVQASVATGLPLAESLGAPMHEVLTSTSWGTWWLVRVALFGGLAALLLAPLPAAVRPYRVWLALAVGLAALLTFSLASHAAATRGIERAAVASDYLHLVAAAAWAGGLLHLAPVVALVRRRYDEAERRPLLAALSRRFSVLAIVSVTALVLTGVFSAWAQVGSADAIATAYGRTLVVKTLVFLGMLGIGALNLLWVRPRLPRHDAAGRRLRAFVAAEAVLAVVVVLATGLLTSVEPARHAAARADDGAVVLRQDAENARVALRIAPGTVGPNTLTVEVDDLRGTPVTNAARVSLRVTYLDEDLGDVTLVATHQGDGRYLIERANLGVTGTWQAAVTAVRPDAFDTRATFTLRMPLDAQGAGGAPSPGTARLLWTAQLVGLGVVLFVVGARMEGPAQRGARRRGGSIGGAVVTWSGATAVVLGILVLGTPIGGADAGAGNPVPMTAESLERGQQIYLASCATCHGEEGRGDGPTAPRLDPPPVDFVVHAPLHTDVELFNAIRLGTGIPGSAMPSFPELSEQETWDVVNYLRSVSEPQPVTSR